MTKLIYLIENLSFIRMLIMNVTVFLEIYFIHIFCMKLNYSQVDNVSNLFFFGTVAQNKVINP